MKMMDDNKTNAFHFYLDFRNNITLSALLLHTLPLFIFLPHPLFLSSYYYAWSLLWNLAGVLAISYFCTTKTAKFGKLVTVLNSYRRETLDSQLLNLFNPFKLVTDHPFQLSLILNFQTSRPLAGGTPSIYTVFIDLFNLSMHPSLFVYLSN